MCSVPALSLAPRMREATAASPSLGTQLPWNPGYKDDFHANTFQDAPGCTALGVKNVPNLDTLVVTLATRIEVALENRQLEIGDHSNNHNICTCTLGSLLPG